MELRVARRAPRTVRLVFACGMRLRSSQTIGPSPHRFGSRSSCILFETQVDVCNQVNVALPRLRLLLRHSECSATPFRRKLNSALTQSRTFSKRYEVTVRALAQWLSGACMVVPGPMWFQGSVSCQTPR